MYSVSAFVHISNFLPHESRQIHLHVYEKMKYVLAHKNIGGSIFLKIMLGTNVHKKKIKETQTMLKFLKSRF